MLHHHHLQTQINKHKIHNYIGTNIQLKIKRTTNCEGVYKSICNKFRHGFNNDCAEWRKAGKSMCLLELLLRLLFFIIGTHYCRIFCCKTACTPWKSYCRIKSEQNCSLLAVPEYKNKLLIISRQQLDINSSSKRCSSSVF